MPANNFNIQGLTDEQVLKAREAYGINQLSYKKENTFLENLLGIFKEPMLILLLVAASIYLISGNVGDAIFMTCAIIFQISISLYQDSRSKNALEKLKALSQPNCKVIRNGEMVEIKSEALVVGDSLVVEEGTLITADGVIVHSNDFSVNESILTGESMAVLKDKTSEDHFVYSGTTVAGGLAVATVTAIGNETRLGKIGSSLEGIKEEKTPLENQIANFVKKMAMLGAVVFVIVWAINFINTQQVLHSLLQSLTLAMSILPEEIPVAFTTFMALGAWRLMKEGIVVKQMKTVETLGSATVICTDKTGTLTENRMSLAKLYLLSANRIFEAGDVLNKQEKELMAAAMWASEPVPFDPMEIALHNAYGEVSAIDERPDYRLVHEYPLSGKPPMMTHVFENKAGKRKIAAKGAPEALMSISGLTDVETKQINEAINLLAADGYRLLGVAVTEHAGDVFPAAQQDFKFSFKGIVAFYDPPKPNIKEVLEGFYKAGIDVKVITGDNSATTTSIARQIGLKGYETSITGDELMALPANELNNSVMKNTVFTRMFPEAKLKIINALKANNQIVAMTGDGVNDGPALKAAHIGISMGKKGTEIAKQAASLILLEDDLSKMVDAVAMGRKIYANLKKAIQYIISIHIPIILTVFIPLALGWVYPNIFSPVHIIFLEIIMGPTCSIIYENEPMEKNTMTQRPKPMSVTFFNWKELSTSILQGLVITLGTLSAYVYAVQNGYSEALTRTMVFTVLITANIFLTLINRSFYYSILTTLRYKNNLVLFIVSVTSFMVILMLYLKPVTVFFGFQSLNAYQLMLAMLTGFISVIWFEIVKWFKRMSKNRAG
ncbi:cation-translocating P-type ATPase [Emticicia sp. 21SJ11W-3]|uniref:cation-translocating P-type ATPase n=1 Tax=Emticicia sp. 21SJ11W-3 TaxID=2916755 RepID=UPI00209DE4FF|nr:cation-translocating P-type ATPase [Emticicia sp. 21SJ11W-3]UTA67959.1 cation-translocating P-type ATPase [Emticicia sp. 21SJ11W-3]